MMAKQFLPSGSAVKHLHDAGFLQIPGTTCGHCVWLSEEEQDMMAAAGATAVHNPFSNIRLGSGIAPLFDYAKRGVNVCLGADGACSSDGQDMLEVCEVTVYGLQSTVYGPRFTGWGLATARICPGFGA
jgi:cytosine/adenosine deaminase-related metal-dependent hydrolase